LVPSASAYAFAFGGGRVPDEETPAACTLEFLGMKEPESKHGSPGRVGQNCHVSEISGEDSPEALT
jgi:hypothetical protein